MSFLRTSIQAEAMGSLTDTGNQEPIRSRNRLVNELQNTTTVSLALGCTREDSKGRFYACPSEELRAKSNFQRYRN